MTTHLYKMILLNAVVFLLLLDTFVLTKPLEARTKNEDVKLNGRSSELPSHMLQMEHRTENEESLKNVVKKVLSSKTANAMDEMVSSVVSLAGGVVEDLGDLMVETIDQLPDTIRIVSDVVGKAVDLKREKVLIMVKGIRMEDEVEDAKVASERIASAVDASKLKSSLTKLEEAFASMIGKFIGVTFKNAESINSAFNDGIKRLAGDDDKKETSMEKAQSKIVKLLEKESESTDEENKIPDS